jgi:N-acetylglucosamine-6-phosphate deacetylase
MQRYAFLFLVVFAGLGAQEGTMRERITCFKNGRVLRSHQIVEEALWIAGGTVVPAQLKADVEVDCEGKIIAPGFVDIQINGAFGVDFTTQPERVEEVALALPQFGVTSFAPTMVTAAPDAYKQAIPLLSPRPVERGAEILGSHLEGPFISPSRHGAHDPNLMCDCPTSKKALEEVYGPFDGVKLVTLAPELPGAIDAIRLLTQNQIVVSAGHSEATREQTESAVDAGLRLVTHLFNAMPGFHHRNSGLVGEALNNPKLWYSLVCDGIHLEERAVQTAWKMHPTHLVLVSDGMAAMGLEPGEYDLGLEKVHVDGNKATIVGTDTLAGSICPLNLAVRKLKQTTGCSDVEALEAASLRPAQVLGLDGKKGTLTVGSDADFVLLDDTLEVQATYVAGQLVWELS